MIDDMNLTMVIESKIFNDPYLSGLAVSVDEVTRTGVVESDFAKKRATELAENVDGVRKVNTLLVMR